MGTVRTGLIAALGAALASGLALVAGCAIQLPPYVAPREPGDGDDDVLRMSLTHAVIDGRNRRDFDRYTRRIVDVLPSQPGLVSFSVRRELIGDQVWTITVWDSDESRDRFFASGLHRDAMAAAGAAIVNVRTRRLDVRRGNLPVAWADALELLGDPAWQASASNAGRATSP